MAESGIPVPGSYYIYAPNKGAAVFFSIAFIFTGGWHLYQCFRFKSFKVTALLPLAGAIFIAAFIARCVGAWDYSDLPTFVTSTILFYMAPPILELVNYHILGRILYYIPYCAPIHPGRTLTTFGALSSIVEVLNGLGVAWSANPNAGEDFIKTGADLLKASLLLQVVVVVLFVLLVAVFQYRCMRRGIFPTAVSTPVIIMYTNSFLIMVRCIYRVVENFLAGGSNATTAGALPSIVRYEWFFYVLEVCPMFIVMILWNVFHPRRFLPENYHIYLAQDGKTELNGEGWNDNRPLIVTICDPFGWFDRSSRKNERPFWETDGIENNGIEIPDRAAQNSAAESNVYGAQPGAKATTTDYTATTAAPSASHSSPGWRRNRSWFAIFMDPFGWFEPSTSKNEKNWSGNPATHDQA